MIKKGKLGSVYIGEYTYDSQNRLVTALSRTSTGAFVGLFRCRYNSAGDVIEFTDSSDASQRGVTRTSITYDANHRAINGNTYTYSNAAGTANTTNTYSYNSQGLLAWRTSKKTITGGMIQTDSSSFVYSTTGRIVSSLYVIKFGNLALSSAATTYTYDSNGNLVTSSTNTGSGNSTITYTYDSGHISHYPSFFDGNSNLFYDVQNILDKKNCVKEYTGFSSNVSGTAGTTIIVYQYGSNGCPTSYTSTTNGTTQNVTIEY